MAGYKNLMILFSGTMILFFASCCENKKVAKPVTIPEKAILVTVKDYRELDGCEFLLETAEGKKYQPINLHNQFKVPNLKMYITFKPIKDGASICMSGEMIELILMQETK